MYRTRPSTPDDLAGRDLRFYLFYRRGPSMSGQLPYERRIDKNVRGLSANERTQTPFFYLSRFSPGVPLLLPSSPSFSSFPPVSECNSFFSFPSTPLRLTLTNFLPFLLSIAIYAVPFPSLTVFAPLAEYIVKRDPVSDQEIALVSSKSNAPEKIEVAPYKKGRNDGEALGAPRRLAFLP